MVICLQCQREVYKRYNKYCSNKCQTDFQYRSFIDAWKQGDKQGGIGIRARNMSGHVIRYMRESYGGACSLCGWSKINVVTNRVPLEIDHIDGNSENNIESNLRLICPNCHALTANYRNLNKGKGREWRRAKYQKNSITPP